jgi:pilus assembly protein CpaF
MARPALDLDFPNDGGLRAKSAELLRGDARHPEDLVRLKSQLHRQLITGMDLTVLATLTRDQLTLEVRRVADELCQRSSGLLSRSERERLVNEVLDETFGLGPLQPLMNDPTISDILINGHDTVYVERNGQLERVTVSFADAQHLLQIVQRIVGQAGRRVDETSPMVDSRLADGSRINAIIPPLALDGALVSIRRFGVRPILASDLVAKGSLTAEMVDFLRACVQARLSILVSGGTGSGKTTLLNALSGFIPPDERVITIEDAAELRLQQPHVGRLETRPANAEGVGAVTTRDLVRNALRMRPDRVIIGECRGPEALDMLQAMNTGHEGSMTTLHANDTRDALARLEIMVGMAGFDLPIWVIRRQVTSAIHLVVQVSRLIGGARKVVKISEVAGLDGDHFAVRDLFVFKQTGLDEARKAQGYFQATGVRPGCLERMASLGAALPEEMFEQRILGPGGTGPASEGIREPRAGGGEGTT